VNRNRPAAAVAAALICLAAACSSGPPGPVSLPGAVVNKGTSDATAGGQAATVTIQTGDDWFNPTYIKVAPGAKVTVDLVDVGTVTHTFTIDGQHIDVVQDRVIFIVEVSRDRARVLNGHSIVHSAMTSRQ